MAPALQRPRRCKEHAEKLTLALLVLGSLAVVVYAGDSFLSASEKVYQSNGKPLAMLLLSSGVFVLIGAMIMIQAFAGWSCRSNDQSTVDRDSWSDDWGWSQGDVLPALRSSHPNPIQGSRCLIWASCTYQQLGADVSAFHTVYACGNHKLAKGSPVSVLPAVPVVGCSTCVCIAGGGLETIASMLAWACGSREGSSGQKRRLEAVSLVRLRPGMMRALQGRRSCGNVRPDKLTVAWLFLGSLAALIYAGDSFLAVQVDEDHGKFLVMLLLYGGVLVLLGAMMHAVTESCRANAQSTVDRDSSRVDASWSQADVLPALRSPTRESLPNQASQGSRRFIWASCTYRQLGADVSAFHTVYSSRSCKLAVGSPVCILPAVPVVRSSTCVCCLEDFRPGSEMAVLKKCVAAISTAMTSSFARRALIRVLEVTQDAVAAVPVADVEANLLARFPKQATRFTSDVVAERRDELLRFSCTMSTMPVRGMAVILSEHLVARTLDAGPDELFQDAIAANLGQQRAWARIAFAEHIVLAMNSVKKIKTLDILKACRAMAKAKNVKKDMARSSDVTARQLRIESPALEVCRKRKRGEDQPCPHARLDRDKVLRHLVAYLQAVAFQSLVYARPYNACKWPVRPEDAVMQAPQLDAAVGDRTHTAAAASGCPGTALCWGEIQALSRMPGQVSTEEFRNALIRTWNGCVPTNKNELSWAGLGWVGWAGLGAGRPVELWLVVGGLDWAGLCGLAWLGGIDIGKHLPINRTESVDGNALKAGSSLAHRLLLPALFAAKAWNCGRLELIGCKVYSASGFVGSDAWLKVQIVGFRRISLAYELLIDDGGRAMLLEALERDADDLEEPRSSVSRILGCRIRVFRGTGVAYTRIVCCKCIVSLSLIIKRFLVIATPTVLVVKHGELRPFQVQY
ncbi:unnamed protein product [Symbiodinium microadriaticum]|nr:unnamed protein product [Symbiodinium microadriaticum]